MKAIVQDGYGPADVLELRDVERPVLRDGDVLVEMRAAGVDPSVWHLMTGLPYMARLAFGLRKPKNPVRGWDGAGRVEAVGEKVTAFKPGDEVFGTFDGAFAEYARARADRLVTKPPELSYEQAAVLPTSGMTALQALRGKTAAGPDRRLLVIGASGGVGSYAVQLAALDGAEVTGVCGPDAADLVRSLGASEVIDYTREEITAGPHRYDVILDAAGNRPLALLRAALAPRGALVFVGGEEGGRWIGMGRQSRALLLSPFTGQSFRNLVALPREEDLLTLRGMVTDGRLRTIIDRTYPLAEAREAVRHLEKGHPRGKLVLVM